MFPRDFIHFLFLTIREMIILNFILLFNILMFFLSPSENIIAIDVSYFYVFQNSKSSYRIFRMK